MSLAMPDNLAPAIAESVASISAPPLQRDDETPLTALVVEDSLSQRKMLSILLRNWKFNVIEAANGRDGLKAFQEQHVDFVISDWMMPEMTGPELCSAIREIEKDQYTYVILLTARNNKSDIAAGLDSGADDFLSKPMDPNELMARIRAGQRILGMHEDLIDKNNRITDAFQHLSKLYDEIAHDLHVAARLQQSLIPPRQAACAGAPIGVHYRPAGHVGGDLVGYFAVNAQSLVVYSIDVSGHGVSSALMTARLANYFTPHYLADNIGVEQDAIGNYQPRDPAAVAADLNARLQDEAEIDLYFTMLYAEINIATGVVRFCQAGHPEAIVMRQQGNAEVFGKGGPPIGLLPGMEYQSEQLLLGPGDRLVLYSDGLTECENALGKMFTTERLRKLIMTAQEKDEADILEDLIEHLEGFAGRKSLGDDVSALMVRMPELQNEMDQTVDGGNFII